MESLQKHDVSNVFSTLSSLLINMWKLFRRLVSRSELIYFSRVLIQRFVLYEKLNAAVQGHGKQWGKSSVYVQVFHFDILFSSSAASI